MLDLDVINRYEHTSVVREYPRPELLSMDAGEQTSVPREQGSQAGDPGPAARLNSNNLGGDFSFYLSIHTLDSVPHSSRKTRKHIITQSKVLRFQCRQSTYGIRTRSSFSPD